MQIRNIDLNFEMSSISIRNEHKGAIESSKSEYFKMFKEIEKLENYIKKERLIEKGMVDEPDESENYNFLNNKIKNQNVNLKVANKEGSEVIDNQTNTMIELQRQRGKLENVNEDLGQVESSLSLHDQFVGVMKNRELCRKLKLVVIILLLFMANVIVLYLKFL